MQSKTLVFILFAAWTGICWRWYVCGVKEACGNSAAVPSAVVETTGIEPDSAALNSASNAVRPLKPLPVDPNNIRSVQMENVEDRMVIYFPYNSIRREDNDAIDEYLSQLAHQLTASNEKVSITGHADFVGSSKFNAQFGLQRANTIRNTLIKKGVLKSQVKCYSFGDRKPVATNDTPQGRYRNRRVEIRVKN